MQCFRNIRFLKPDASEGLKQKGFFNACTFIQKMKLEKHVCFGYLFARSKQIDIKERNPERRKTSGSG